MPTVSAHDSVELAFRLGQKEWDEELRSWSCAALRLRGATVQAVYMRGAPLEPQTYHVNRESHRIEFKGEGEPDEVTATVRIDSRSQRQTTRMTAIAAALVPLPVAGIQYFGATAPLRQRAEDCSAASSALRSERDSLAARARAAELRIATLDAEIAKLRPLPSESCGKISNIRFNGAPPSATIAGPVKVQW